MTFFGEGSGTPLQYSCLENPWTEEPSRLQSMGSLRVGHDWATWLSLFSFLHWRRKWQPTPVFLPGESQGWGSLVAAVYGVTQSWTQLKWLSSSSSISFLERCLFNSYDHFKNQLVWSVCFWIVWVSLKIYVWILTPYQMYNLQIFSHILKAAFSFLW